MFHVQNRIFETFQTELHFEKLIVQFNLEGFIDSNKQRDISPIFFEAGLTISVLLPMLTERLRNYTCFFSITC